MVSLSHVVGGPVMVCLSHVVGGPIMHMHGLASSALIVQGPQWSLDLSVILSVCTFICVFTATSNRMAGIERLTLFGVLDIPVC